MEPPIKSTTFKSCGISVKTDGSKEDGVHCKSWRVVTAVATIAE